MHAKIPIIVFVVTLFATLVMVVLLSRVYDKDTRLPSGSRSLPPFPNVAPLVISPELDPTSTSCVSLVGDATGAYVPAPMNPLRACGSDGDCSGCTSSPIDTPLSCRAPSSDVAAQQAALGNSASAYCLPTPQTCLEPLVACTHDIDCASCSDTVGDQAMQCQIVSAPKKIALDAGELDVPPGQWCLPKTGACDAVNGVLHWTTAGWTCACRYPAIHGGEKCDILKACNNSLTTGWSAGNQQLLLNKPGPPQVWDMASGVNPMLCHVEGEWDKPCEPGTLPNAVCQCDGLMLGSRMGFRNEATDPLTCTPDSCSGNAMGGRASEPLELVDWSPNNPHTGENQCVCSGADSRIWDLDTRDPATLEPELADTLRLQQGYVYTGRCADTTIATNGSVVVLEAEPGHASSAACSRQNNAHAEITSLVPGFADDESGTATVSVCSADPCRGKYSDINFQPPEGLQDWGHYSAEAGACECVNTEEVHTRSVAVPGDGVVNPVSSVCTNACEGMDSANPEDWPCKQDPNRPCPAKPQCITGEQGEAVCVCPAGCGNTDGLTCMAQFDNESSCAGYTEVPNACKPQDGKRSQCKCHRGRDRPDAPLGGLQDCRNTGEFYAMCTTDPNDASCHVGGKRGASSCGGDYNFDCAGIPGCNRTPTFAEDCRRFEAFRWRGTLGSNFGYEEWFDSRFTPVSVAGATQTLTSDTGDVTLTIDTRSNGFLVSFSSPDGRSAVHDYVCNGCCLLDAMWGLRIVNSPLLPNTTHVNLEEDAEAYIMRTSLSGAVHRPGVPSGIDMALVLTQYV